MSSNVRRYYYLALLLAIVLALLSIIQDVSLITFWTPTTTRRMLMMQQQSILSQQSIKSTINGNNNIRLMTQDVSNTTTDHEDAGELDIHSSRWVRGKYYYFIIFMVNCEPSFGKMNLFHIMSDP